MNFGASQRLTATEPCTNRMGIKPYKEPKGDNTEVGRMMKAAFTQDIGPQRMMRGEQIMRTHQVVSMMSEACPSGGGYTLVSAKVYSQHHGSLAPGGAYNVCINFMPMTLADIVLWQNGIVNNQGVWWDRLVQAARLGRKPLEEAEFKDVAALFMRAASHNASAFAPPIIPERWSMAATASCECLDYKRDRAWCKHIGALAYVVIDRCLTDPFHSFELRGFNLGDFLKTAVEPFVGDGSKDSPITLD